MRITFLFTAFLLICLAEEPSGRDSQLDSNRNVALKHNEQHQTQVDHIVQIPDQVDHIGQHQENETTPATASKAAFGTNTDGWSFVARILLVNNCICQLYVLQNEKISVNTSFYGHGQMPGNALRDILILSRELFDMTI